MRSALYLPASLPVPPITSQSRTQAAESLKPALVQEAYMYWMLPRNFRYLPVAPTKYNDGVGPAIPLRPTRPGKE